MTPRFPAGLIATLALATLAPAADWPRFRGPNGTGVADASAPTEFDIKKDAAWKVKLPGVGHGSPILVGDKLYLQAAGEDGNGRSLLCLSAKTGETVWTYAAGGQKAPTHKKNNLASGTPCGDGERVYAAFWDGTGVSLHAVDLKGKKVWAVELGAHKSQHGVGHSPVVAGGLVFVNFDQDGAAELVAFDAKTGEKKWAHERAAHRACYSSPFLIEEKGKAAELVVASTTSIDGYDVATGKVNWTHPVAWAKGEMKLRSIGQPILAAGQIVMPTGDGGGGRYMLAVKADGKKAEKTWELKKAIPYVPGPLVFQDHLFWVGDDGVAGCADAKTGAMKWSERLPIKAVSSSPVLIGDRVLVFAEDGKAVAYPATPGGLGEVKTSTVGEPVFATPAVSDGRLFIRGGDHLFCVRGKGS